MSTKPTTVSEYFATLPEEVQQVLQKIRSAIKKAAPGAEETISYAIPAFKLNDKCFIYYSGYKNHTSIYPAPREHEDFKAELENYKGGKGTVQFPLKEPLPIDLITRIVKLRIKEQAGKAKKK